jgi:phytoene desaturase
MEEKAIIIGGGIGGLAIAVRLAVKGFNVIVFEKNNLPGGKISQFEKNGFRFDTGPSVFTLPNLVDELFEIAGVDPREYFRYEKLNESARYFYEDGSVIDAFSDHDEFLDELSTKTGENPDNVTKFLDKSREIYDITSDVFVFNSIHDRKNIFKASSLKALAQFHKIDAFKTMHEANSKRFNTQKVVQFFDRYATYNGSNPYKVPATLNIIPHLEHNIGAFFPQRGIYSMVEALYKLAVSQGVQFHFNTSVKKLETTAGKVNQVVTDKGTFSADYVISDLDINYFYRNLLENEKKLKKVVKPEKSSSALIFYWGIRKTFPGLKLHNILFSNDYSEEFAYLFNKKQIYNDPTVYIYISSKQNIADAPEGKENWYVMVNAPENVGQDWGTIKQEARKNIINKINRLLKVDIEEYIEFEQINDPVSIEQYTGSYHGSLYGNSSNSKFAAFNRHPNFSNQYKNLFFVGGSVHPGGGIPLCLASAKIVSEKIKIK